MNAERHARIKALFLEACALAPEERSSFVDAACGADGDLRAAVNELLDNDQQPLRMVEQVEQGEGPAVLAAGLARDGALHAHPPRADLPARIGRYRVLCVLGEGGMGTVYEAEQVTPRRRVAVKVIRSGMSSIAVLRRFEHETQLLGRLNHPGIAHVYEAGLDEESGTARPFCAMELVEGRSLVEDATARGLDVRARLELFARVCDAIEHAHENGVLHRDLKPGNILVDRTGQPKVLDFGVARLIERGTATSLTANGAVIGTLAYMSPEQVSGDFEQLDARSDIYSLGVIAYELLCGRLPYDVLDTPIPKAARTICEVDPVPLGDLDRLLRGDLQTIFATALSKDRARRYATAGALAADVRRFLSDQPIVARPTSTLYQLRKFARRNRAFVAGAGIAVAALVAGTITSTLLARKESRERQRADVNAAEAGREAYRANVLAVGMALGNGSPRSAMRLLAGIQPEASGWELSRLRRLTGQWLTEVDPGAGFPWFVAFEPGARTVVVAGSGGAVATVDIETGQPALRLPADRARHAPRALSTDGALSMSVRDGVPIVWSTRTGAEVKRLAITADLHVADRNTAAFSPDARRLVITSHDRGALLFDLSAEGPPVDLPSMKNALGLVAFSADGTRLATTCGEVPEVFDVESGTLIARYAYIGEPKSVAVDAHGTRIAVGSGKSVHIFDVPERRESRVLAGHSDTVTGLAFAPDGVVLAANLEDGSVWFWDCDGGSVLDKAWVGRPSWRTSIAWSPDGSRLVTGAHVPRVVRVWDAVQAREDETLRGHTKFVYPVRYTPDGSRIVSAGWDKTVRIWDAHTNRALAVMLGHEDWVADLAVSPDGERIASVSLDGQLLVWNARTGARLARAPAGQPWRSVAWSPDGRFVAAGEARPPFEIVLFDARTLEPSGRLSGHVRDVNTLAFDPSGSRLASGAEDGSARVFDLASRACISQRKGMSRIYCTRWSPDGRVLALSGYNFLEIADAQTLEPIRALIAHPHEVFSADFSPDGKRLFSGGRDGQLLVWELASGALVGQFDGPRDYIWSIAVSPDGTRVATGSGDCGVRQWESQPVRETLERRSRAARLADEARPIVERHFAELLDADTVVARLKTDLAARPDLRDVALSCALERAAPRSAPSPAAGPPR